MVLLYPHFAKEYIFFVAFLSEMLYDKKKEVIDMSMNRDLHQQLFQRREAQMQHLEYHLEFQFYHAVASGDVKKVSQYLMDAKNEQIYSGASYGKLSNNALQNARYHFVVAVALITRICVEQGLNREVAYTLSDLFIQKMDNLQSISSITTLHNEMILDFTKRMQNARKEPACSLHVRKAMEYISMHLQEPIQTAQLADALSLNRSYLSTLFHRETGKTLHQYILSEKIHAAAELLTTSEISCSDLAAYYCFSSQSHFIQCFQKEMGDTPAEYRKRFYQKSDF